MPDIHTSDLTASCQRYVQLRAAGHIVPQMTTALFKGTLGHDALQIVHERGFWTADHLPVVMRDARKATGDKIEREGRPMTDAVTASLETHVAEVTTLIGHYQDRFRAYFEHCKVIAVEPPIRWTFTCDDGVEFSFASHLDLLFRGSAGDLCVWDWKFQEEGPTYDFLSRNLQLACYYFAALEGQVMIDDDFWIRPGEAPTVSWISMYALKPYARKTKGKDETGEEVTYSKGDTRPLNRIVHSISHTVESRAALITELTTRRQMRDAGLYPTNPDKVGCLVCEARQFCERYTQQENSR